VLGVSIRLGSFCILVSMLATRSPFSQKKNFVYVYYKRLCKFRQTEMRRTYRQCQKREIDSPFALLSVRKKRSVEHINV
jgi:hypothetical protein